MDNNTHTSEYVRRGHPDRVCDIIADALLDEFLKQDPMARTAIEVMGSHGIITVGGEITTTGYINIPKTIREVLDEIGYTEPVGIQTNIVEQSPEIKVLADVGAGDSGIMIGYATNETKEMLPMATVIAKDICDYFDNAEDILKDIYGLLPDGKVQVTMKGETIERLVMAIQTKEGWMNQKTFEDSILKGLEKLPSISGRITKDTLVKIIQFHKGGFHSDTGLTGRKNAIWYGAGIPTGGGAFAGKDCTKVDRTGAYIARNIAMEFVKNGFRGECLVKIAYAIGDQYPYSLLVNGVETPYREFYTLENLIKEFNLREPIFKEASMKGHFGYDSNWDKLH